MPNIASKMAQHRANIGQHGANIRQHRPNLGQHRPNIGQRRPNIGPTLGRRGTPNSFTLLLIGPTKANRQSQRQRRQRQTERERERERERETETETETETDRERDGERDDRDRRPNMVVRFSHVVDAGVLAFERRGRRARRRTSVWLQRLSRLSASAQRSQGSQPPPGWRMLLGCPMLQPPRKPLFWHALCVIVCLSVVYCVLLRNVLRTQPQPESAHRRTAASQIHKNIRQHGCPLAPCVRPRANLCSGTLCW